MADLNNFSFTGRLTKDAEYRTLASGKGVLTANVAVNTGYGDFKKTLYIKVQQWGDSGKNIVSYLKKGSMITACGEVSLNKWTNQEGKEYTDVQVDVRGIQMLSTKSQDKSSNEAESTDSYEAF